MTNPIPRATYRLQFHAGFRFADAAALVPQLARLGISHIYASPILKARPGSTHGYDMVDHNALNPELGTEAEFRAMCAAFREHGLGMVLDFVPNHMGVGGADNPWWLDVLEWGEASDYAGWFDIDWDPDRRYLTGKLLVPFLGDQYGAVLEAGGLELRFDAAEGSFSGSFSIWAYGTHRLPICPLHYARVLGDAHPVLERLGDAFAQLPHWRPHIPRKARDLKAELAAAAQGDEAVREAIAAAVAALNADHAALDALIRDQHWRAAHHRVAADDINYRRFFNINELAGLRMELPELFDHAHRLVFSLLEEGVIEGLRIDHVDGLLDPKGYLEALRAKAPRPFYLLVEKILARHESLREDWPVEGTTGYEFANLLLGLLADPAGEAALTRAYQDFAGPQPQFAEVVRACKLRIMEQEMASELNMLARDGARIARRNPRTADFTRNIIARGLREIVAAFPVYRTYLDWSATASAEDRRDLDWAVAQARRQAPDLDPSVFDLLHGMLSGDLVARPRSGFSRQAVTRFAMRVQQYSGPVMAKGLEDTAFYRWHRLAALNEVGGHPDHLGLSLPAFHKANAARARSWPHAMLSTSTHDTKRGEDVRARLLVLSELPEDWARHLTTCSRILRARRGDVEGTAPPDRNDEALLHQLLLGAWPATPAGMDGFAERLEGALVKSLREAKLRSSWTAPDAAYEGALVGMMRDALGSPAFLEAFAPFQRRVAELGVWNSLVQVALKLTLPGIPDLYQGTEFWDLSLVDPDNRRPVDHAARAAALEEVLAAPMDAARAAALLAAWPDGRIKLAVTAAILGHRRAHPAVFAEGGYTPLAATGPDADRIIAFARGDGLVVVACRFPARGPIAPGTALDLPEGAWRDLLTGRAAAREGLHGLAALLAPLPVAVLVPAA